MTTSLRRILLLLCGALCCSSVGCDNGSNKPAAVPAEYPSSVSQSTPVSVKSPKCFFNT